MNREEYKPDERELIRLVRFFKKRAASLLQEGKLDTSNGDVIGACERLLDSLGQHAEYRSKVLATRSYLEGMINDNAVCPKCNTSAQLKKVGVEPDTQGWKYNRYRCRRCNIEFTWGTPNNPWDMLGFIETTVVDLEKKVAAEPNDDEREKLTALMANMQENLDKLRPVIEGSDRDFEEMQDRDKEIERMVHEFKNHLLIEKIRLDTYENPN
jgi:hypothetical protein